MDIKQLTKEEKAQLLIELAQEQKNAQKEKEKAREDYRDMVSNTVNDVFIYLQDASEYLKQVKKRVFDDFAYILEQKQKIYGIKDGQQSHTFTTADGSKSITIGYRVVDCYDDTVSSGIAKIHNYINSLAKDDETRRIVEIINKMLKVDKKGNLKPSRVLELQQLSNKIEDSEFLDGLEIIKNAYKPVRTSLFVECEVKDANGVKHSLPLSISSIVL
ncbi:MAG: DUF3164 family protein [Bacteroidales bacterium]